MNIEIEDDTFEMLEKLKEEFQTLDIDETLKRLIIETSES